MTTDPVLTHAIERRDDIIAPLCDWLRCPSVGVDPAFAQGMEDARRLLETWFTEIGFANLQRLDGGGQAAIYAEWLGAPGRPTLLVYGHYDVQPLDPLDL